MAGGDSAPDKSETGGAHQFSFAGLGGGELPLSAWAGKPVLIVNTASCCGYTPQYRDLEALWQSYRGRGLVVLGVPSNDFGAQEPGTNEEIKTFCSRKYSVSFPLYAKVSVKGDDQTALYRYLTRDANPAVAGDIKWNFTKFLVDRSGNVLQRFEPAVTPDSKEVVSAVEKLLKQ